MDEWLMTPTVAELALSVAGAKQVHDATWNDDSGYDTVGVVNKHGVVCIGDPLDLQGLVSGEDWADLDTTVALLVAKGSARLRYRKVGPGQYELDRSTVVLLIASTANAGRQLIRRILAAAGLVPFYSSAREREFEIHWKGNEPVIVWLGE